MSVIQLGSSGTRPAGNVTPNLFGFNWFAHGAYWQELGRQCYADKLSSTPIPDLWVSGGYCVRTSWYGVDVHGGVSAFGIPLNVVPGTQTLVPVTLGTYAAESDAVNMPLYAGMSEQNVPLAAGGNPRITGASGSVDLVSGSASVLGHGTSFLTTVLAGDTIQFWLPSTTEATLYTVLSVADDTHLTLTAPYVGPLGSGAWANGPFNRPPADADLVDGDAHTMMLMRDESAQSTLKKLYESYQTTSEDGGATWNAAWTGVWDLNAGTQRLDGFTAGSTAGLPIAPFLIRYEECAAGINGVQHPLRLAITNTQILTRKAVWPATHGASAGSSGFPYGARLRLSNDWYMANVADFPAIIQPILNAFRLYGAFVTDGTSFQLEIDGVNDDRWVKNDLLSMWQGQSPSLPLSALEVCDTIRSQLALRGPATGVAGVAQTFTIEHVELANTNFSASVYIAYSDDGGATLHAVGSPQTFDETHRGPMTFTWTPAATGNYIVQPYISSGAYWYLITSPFVASAGSPATRTTTTNGFWDVGSTWIGGVPPGAGDKAILLHNVTVRVDTMVGDGSNTTVLDCSHGTLTVTGAVLTIAGLSVFGHNTSGTTTTCLTVQNSGSTPAGIILDGASGVAPGISIDNDTMIVFSGTSSAHVFLQTNATTAGLAGFITTIGFLRCFFMTAAYCDFSRLGDASTSGLLSLHTHNSNLTNAPFTMDHCTIDSCGQFPRVGTDDGTVNLSITNCVWSNEQDAGGLALTISTSGTVATGTRLFDRCVVPGAPQFNASSAIAVTNSYFDSIIYGAKLTAPWASFDGNFFRHSLNAEVQCGGSITNCYLFTNVPDPTQVVSGIIGNRATTAQSFSYNIIQSSCNIEEYGAWIFASGENGIQATVVSNIGNIFLPNAGGFGSATAKYIGDNPSDPGDGSPWPIAVAEHNTVCVTGTIGVMVGVNTDVCPTGLFTSCKSNIFWASSSTVGQYAATTANATSPPADPITGANCDYNCSYNLPTTSRFSSPNNAANGTVYDIPMTTVPGVHDVVNTNPNFVDPTRNLQTWSVMKGYSASTDTYAVQTYFALKAIQADPTLTKTDLIPWVRAGFAPKNVALHNAASDGTDIGAVSFFLSSSVGGAALMMGM